MHSGNLVIHSRWLRLGLGGEPIITNLICQHIQVCVALTLHQRTFSLQQKGTITDNYNQNEDKKK